MNTTHVVVDHMSPGTYRVGKRRFKLLNALGVYLKNGREVFKIVIVRGPRDGIQKGRNGLGVIFVEVGI